MAATVSRGHHHSAGIVPVFLDATDVARLHRLAEHLDLKDQDAARLILRNAMIEWEDVIHTEQILDSVDRGGVETLP